MFVTWLEPASVQVIYPVGRSCICGPFDGSMPAMKSARSVVLTTCSTSARLMLNLARYWSISAAVTLPYMLRTCWTAA